MSRDGALAISPTDQPSPDEVAFIEEKLVAYNVAKARPYDRRPLNVFLRDERGGVVGGLTGQTNWEWLYIDCFWLPDDLRGDGWGARLLEAAESEARARGCGHARLFSYSFQAPEFYERHGYKAFGVLEGYPPGEKQVWLRKDL
jgi:GNAT superfamily N-acetyltransferase